MKFDPVNKKCDRSLRQQLREQIIYRITTGELQVGKEMYAVRDVAHQLGIALNTVSSVYSELVQEGWLVEQPGTHHIVISRIRDNDLKTRFEDLDELVDHTIKLALKNGYPLEHVVSRLQDRLLDQPPDHFLLVEPEPGLGELMREEIRERVGFYPAGCTVAALRQDPGKSIGAVLLTPIYLRDKLEFLPSYKQHIETLFVSRPDEHCALVRGLPQASVVGMASISPAAVETARNFLATALGERHTSREFLMEWPVDKDGPHFRDFSEYKRIYVRKPAEGPQSDGRGEVAGSDRPHNEDGRLLSAADLDFVDVLFCDSIAYKAVKHRRCIRWQFLSDESLEAVATKYKSLRRDIDNREAERRAAAAKVEAERPTTQEIAIAKQVQ